MKVARLLVVALVVVAVLANEVDTEETVEEPRSARRPRKGKKLVAPTVLPRRPLMKKSSIIIVPKGDPRAYGRAAGQNPFGEAQSPVTPFPSSGPILKSANPGCDRAGGVCATSCPNGRFVRGLCSGTPVCCVPNTPSPQPQPPAADCPVYGSAQAFAKSGNGGVVYQVVPIDRNHLVDPAKFGLSDTEADNTIRKDPTACAFARMAAAAAAQGVSLKIASGFRTLARQQYFWNCYQTKRCNGGNLAARPGTSNHGTGIALDLNTDCGGQAGSVAPSTCRNSKVYVWLINNGPRFGFIRAVQKEPWHWEYHPGSALPSWAKFSGGVLKASTPVPTAGKKLQAGAPAACPVYGNAPLSNIKGNGGKTYAVVRIAPQHFIGSADNSMTRNTACAFARMAEAARKAGVQLKIASGFRTLARQQYFWNCYQTKKCNNGNLAARPGTSNHGTGIALDLNTGGTTTTIYKWLAKNAATYGFRRTVPSEAWHWEYRP